MRDRLFGSLEMLLVRGYLGDNGKENGNDYNFIGYTYIYISYIYIYIWVM